MTNKNLMTTKTDKSKKKKKKIFLLVEGNKNKEYAYIHTTEDVKLIWLISPGVSQPIWWRQFSPLIYFIFMIFLCV